MFNINKNQVQTLALVGLLGFAAASCTKKDTSQTQMHGQEGGMHHDHDHGQMGMENHSHAEGYELFGQISPNPGQPGKAIHLTFQIKDKEGKALTKFKLNHEKLAHLIIVRDDLAYFYHEHPELSSDGTFSIDLTLPQAGKYLYFVDYMTEDGAEGLGRGSFEVSGNYKPVPLAVAKNFTKEVDGVKVTLKPQSFAVGEDIMPTFSLTDAKTGAPIKDLELYMGALGHGVIISQDGQTYLHVHPMTEVGSGPDVTFHTKFNKPGIYKFWGQFKRQGKVLVADYTIRVI